MIINLLYQEEKESKNSMEIERMKMRTDVSL